MVEGQLSPNPDSSKFLCAPHWCEEGVEVVEEEGIVRAVRVSFEEDGTQAVTWEQVKRAASVDETCRSLIQAIGSGFW